MWIRISWDFKLVLQQDNGHKHTSENTKEWLENKKGTVIWIGLVNVWISV